MDQTLQIYYKIYLEAEDITQSRIQSTSLFFKNLFLNCENQYLKIATIDNESDFDDFSLRLYVDETIEEAVCKNEKDAKTFVMDMIEFLDKLAAANSYLDMEGSFGISYQGEKKDISFKCEGGQSYCDFTV